MKVFFQAHSGLPSFAATVKPHHERYAELHDIDYRMIEGDPDLSPLWIKFYELDTLLKSLPDGAQVVYADLDSVVRKSKFNVDIFDFFTTASFDFAAMPVGIPRFHLVNLGVVFCFNTPKMRSLVSDVIENRGPISTDEMEIVKRLNAPHDFVWAPLPAKYNNWNSFTDPDPIIVSFHGNMDKELLVLEETL